MSCVVDADNQTSCVCNDKCDGYYNPVCGSDNKTYDNYCQFNYVVCQTNISSAFYYGVCPEGQKKSVCVCVCVCDVCVCDACVIEKVSNLCSSLSAYFNCSTSINYFHHREQNERDRS